MMPKVPKVLFVGAWLGAMATMLSDSPRGILKCRDSHDAEASA